MKNKFAFEIRGQQINDQKVKQELAHGINGSKNEGAFEIRGQQE